MGFAGMGGMVPIWENADNKKEKEDTPTESQKQMWAEEAANFKLIENDQKAQELYDAVERHRKEVQSLMYDIAQLSPDKETFMSRIKNGLTGERKEKDAKVIILQEKLEKLKETEANGYKEWLIYAQKNRKAFLGDLGNAWEDYTAAKFNEDMRQRALENPKQESEVIPEGPPKESDSERLDSVRKSLGMKEE